METKTQTWSFKSDQYSWTHPINQSILLPADPRQFCFGFLSQIISRAWFLVSMEWCLKQFWTWAAPHWLWMMFVKSHGLNSAAGAVRAAGVQLSVLWMSYTQVHWDLLQSRCCLISGIRKQTRLRLETHRHDYESTEKPCLVRRLTEFWAQPLPRFNHLSCGQK